MKIRSLTALIVFVALRASSQTAAPAVPAATVESKTATDLHTLSGKTYKAARIGSVDPDGITYFFTGGVVKVPFTDLPEATRQQYHYDPKTAAAFSKADDAAQEDAFRKNQAIAATIIPPEALDAQRADAARRDDFLKATLHTLHEVETDMPGFVNKLFTVRGTIDVSSFYNHGYADARETHFAFKLSDGHSQANCYAERERGQSLRDQILRAGPLEGTFGLMITSDRYEGHEPKVFAELIGWAPPQ